MYKIATKADIKAMFVSSQNLKFFALKKKKIKYFRLLHNCWSMNVLYGNKFSVEPVKIGGQTLMSLELAFDHFQPSTQHEVEGFLSFLFCCFWVSSLLLDKFFIRLNQTMLI